MNPTSVLNQNIEDPITQNPPTALPQTEVDVAGEKEKSLLQRIGEEVQNISDALIIGKDRFLKSDVDYNAPFMTIGDKTFFTTEDGKTGVSESDAIQRQLLRQNKMTRGEATAARNTGDMILGTVAPAPKDGSTPAFITDPDDPSKKLRRLYSPITGEMLNQYGDVVNEKIEAVNSIRKDGKIVVLKASYGHIVHCGAKIK